MTGGTRGTVTERETVRSRRVIPFQGTPISKTLKQYKVVTKLHTIFLQRKNKSNDSERGALLDVGMWKTLFSTFQHSTTGGKLPPTPKGGTDIICPICNGDTKKNGRRKLRGMMIQAWMCKNCSYQFTDYETEPSEKQRICREKKKRSFGTASRN